MLKFENVKSQVFILFFCISLVLMLRISIESTGYLTTDSVFYLRAADNQLAGKGVVSPQVYPFTEESEETFFSMWPIGYPLLITVMSKLSGLSTFLSSKVINLLFLALIFKLVYHWYGAKSLLPLLYFCSYGKLEVYSHTWSEGAFLFVIIWMLYLFEKIISNKAILLDFVLFGFSLVFLVFLRYVGLIYYFYFSFIILYFIYQKRFSLVKQLTTVLAISSVIVFAYLWCNYLVSGGFFGGVKRVFLGVEGGNLFFKTASLGLFNEFCILRNFFFGRDILFVVLLVFQVIVGYLVFIKGSLLQIRIINRDRLLFSAGIFYLISITILRWVSPFDTFDYRILAPFSTPVFIALLGSIELNKHKTKYILLVCFFLFSLLMNLPKVFLLQQIGVM
jgi:hypothetical protein